MTETLRSLKDDVEDEARRSAYLLPELLQEPPEERLRRIANEPRFHAVKLCQLLQDRSRADWFQEPARSLESARLAVAVADHLNEGRYGSGVVAEARARAWAHLGNSLRMNCKLRDAEQALGKAAEHQRLSGDPLAESEILAFTASLRHLQGRSEETIVLLERAFAISREIGDRLREGRVLILKGTALGDAGRYREALRILRKGRMRIDPESEPELAFIALHNIVLYLLNMGRPVEAKRMVGGQPRPVGRRLQTRFEWLDALISQHLGRSGEAQSILWKVREDFDDQRLPLEWAQVSLDLISSLFRQGRPAEGRRLVEEVIPVLDHLDAERDARIARRLYLRLSPAAPS
ncbi:MAG: tetratricopeptide repeat protein [Thermoanaerobaculia bacterium]